MIPFRRQSCRRSLNIPATRPAKHWPKFLPISAVVEDLCWKQIATLHRFLPETLMIALQKKSYDFGEKQTKDYRTRTSIHKKTQKREAPQAKQPCTALPQKKNKLSLIIWPACKRTRKGKVIEVVEISHMASHGHNYKLQTAIPKINISLGLQIESRARPLINCIHILYKDQNLALNRDQ